MPLPEEAVPAAVRLQANDEYPGHLVCVPFATYVGDRNCYLVTFFGAGIRTRYNVFGTKNHNPLKLRNANFRPGICYFRSLSQ